MIKLKNVSKKFKTATILSNISLEIQKGEFVVLVGLSGCGKTTTLKMINRLIKATSGQITIEDKDVLKSDPIKLRRNIGYVIQQTGLFPHMTIRDNIELIPKAEKISKDKIEKRTMELMDLVGLEEEFLDRYPNELSGGQQQRVGVARAFALDPDVILMDEPFSALDPITRSGLQDELISLQSKLKKTIVFVTHDMSEAIKLADRICIMDHGKIIQYDTPENILKNPVNDFVSEFVGENRIWSSPEFIRAKDIMIEEPVTCSIDFPLNKCLEKMRTAKVDSLMVIENKTKKLLGVLGAKQVQNLKDRSIPIKDIMVSDYLYTTPEDNILDILQVVDENNVSNIPVIDESRTLKGLITKSSLVTTLSQQYLEASEVN